MVKRITVATFFTFIFLFGQSSLASTIISGSVDSSYDGGIIATGAWDNGGATLTFSVEQVGELYHYSYTYNVDQKELSGIIIEVSDTFTEDNIFAGTTPDWELGTFGSQGNSTPGIPSDLYGIKFTGQGLYNEYSLFSDRAPMEGCFYAKDGVDGGNDVYAYNSGFCASGELITAEGTLSHGMIAVPDTVSAVPLPASAWLFGSALLGMVGVSRRKKV